MKKVLMTCISFLVLVVLAATIVQAARAAPDPQVAASCNTCTLNTPMYFSGTGWKPSIHVYVNVLSNTVPSQSWTIDCGHADHNGSFDACAFTPSQSDSYSAWGQTPFAPPNSNYEQSPLIVFSVQ